jgi:translation elongation factor EF-Ts
MNDGVSVEARAAFHGATPHTLTRATLRQDAVKGVAAKAGMPLSVASFVRLQVGEGIEREAKDFAAEVAAAARA